MRLHLQHPCVHSQRVFSHCSHVQLFETMDCSPVGSSVHRILQTRILEWGLPCSPSGDLPNPGTEPRSPALQADSLPAGPQGKPKNTGMGGLSLLQRIFLTQELNWGLLHYRWILYQLSYQGIPIRRTPALKNRMPRNKAEFS